MEIPNTQDSPYLKEFYEFFFSEEEVSSQNQTSFQMLRKISLEEKRQKVLPFLNSHLNNSNPKLRSRAIFFLATFGDLAKDALPVLRQIAKDEPEHSVLREDAKWAITQIFRRTNLSNLESMLNFIFYTLFSLVSLFVILIFVEGILFHRKKGNSSNETSAIGTLRTLCTSQKQFKAGKVKDRDNDGIGEYGYFVELSGISPVPVGTELKKAVRPAFATSVLGKTSQENAGIAKKSGYYFKIYLPSSGKLAKGEDGKVVNPVKKLPPDAEIREEINHQEMRWCAYAWPIEAGVGLGNRAFFINELGEVFATSNIPEGTSTLHYSGITKMPNVFDIYRDKDKGDLESQLILGKPSAHQLIWNPLH